MHNLHYILLTLWCAWGLIAFSISQATTYRLPLGENLFLAWLGGFGAIALFGLYWAGSGRALP